MTFYQAQLIKKNAIIFKAIFAKNTNTNNYTFKAIAIFRKVQFGRERQK